MLPLQDRLGLRLIGVRDGEGMTDHSLTALAADMPDTPIDGIVLDTDDDFAVMYSSGSTGTPKGVGPIEPGDRLVCQVDIIGRMEVEVR